MSKFKKTVGSLSFLTSKARITFTKLRQVFVKTLILHHFDPIYHIQIERDASGYAIDEVFNG